MLTRNRCGSGEKGNNFLSIGDDFPESFSASLDWVVLDDLEDAQADGVGENVEVIGEIFIVLRILAHHYGLCADIILQDLSFHPPSSWRITSPCTLTTIRVILSVEIRVASSRRYRAASFAVAASPAATMVCPEM